MQSVIFKTQLTRLFETGAWFGDSFTEKLQGVSEEEAFTKPLPSIHSIAEIVSHCLYWRNSLINRLEGKSPQEDAQDNWMSNEKLKAMGWKPLYERLSESQNKLTALLAIKDDDFFTEEYEPGTTYHYLTEGVIQHDIYHLGQIGLVKKLVQEKTYA